MLGSISSAFSADDVGAGVFLPWCSTNRLVRYDAITG
jgi:hypothetical protein